MKIYYIHDGKEQTGPFTFEELKQKQITPITMVWREGLKNWVKAGDLNELSQILKNEKSQIPPPLKTEKGLPSISGIFRYKNQLTYLLIGILLLTVLIMCRSNNSVKRQFEVQYEQQKKREEDLHQRLSDQEEYYRNQTESISRRVLEQEQREGERAEYEMQLDRSIKVQELNEELKIAFQNLEKARKNLNSVSEFKFLRTSGQRDADIRKASELVNQCQQRLEELENQKRNLYN